MIRRLVIVAVLLVATVHAFTQRNNVLILSDADLQTITDQFPNILIAYLEPDSKPCQEWTQAIEQIAEEFKQKNYPLRLATINCEDNPQSFEFGQLRAIPTLIYYHEGYPTTFQGDRSKDYLQKWLTKQVASPVAQLTKAQLETLRESNSDKVSIVFIGSVHSVRGHQFTQLATDDHYNDYYFIEEQIEPYGTVLLLRSFADDLTYPSFDEEVFYWIAKYDRPDVVPFDSRSMTSVFKEGRTGILFFIEEDYKNKIELFTEAAKQWKPKELSAISITFITVTSQYEHYQNFVEYLKIDPTKQPVVIVNGGLEGKYILKQKINRLTWQSIVEFLENYQKGSLEELPLDPHAQQQRSHEQSTEAPSEERIQSEL